MKKTNTYYIVDDDIDDQQFLIEALTESDPSAQCFTATKGQDAIEHLQKAETLLPDAIFLDLNMPGINGKQCLAELKQISSLQQIPIIIYSTSSNKRDIQETMQLGASYFLVKQNSYKELCEALATIISVINNVES